MWVTEARAETPVGVEVGGFAEAYGQVAAGAPANGVTALRGFDARNGTFALSLASVGVAVVHPVARGRVALQAGPTALSYFGAEPRTAGGVGVSPTGPLALHPVREAWAGARAPVGVSVDGGVFLSPVGFDAIAAKDNPCWSLSNLGVGLPFYFTGARATAELGGGVTASAWVVNGWNSVVDGHPGPAAMLTLGAAGDGGAAGQVLWLASDEGTGGLRQLFDTWGKAPLGPATAFAGVDGGFEPRDAGLRTWVAGQLGAEVALGGPWSVTARGDVFREAGPDGVAGNVFWPTSLLGEGTLAVGLRPAPGLLVRLEGRHDRAADPVFWRGDAPTPTATTQTTVTLGVSGSFAAAVAGPAGG